MITENQLHEEALALETVYGGMAIASQDEADRAGVALSRIAEAVKKIDEFCDPEIAAAHKLHKSLVAKKKKLRQPFDMLDRDIRDSLRTWQQKQLESAAVERELGGTDDVATTAGVTFVKDWDVAISDLPALVKAVADGKHPTSWLLPNIPEIRSFVRAVKGNAAIAGVTISETSVVRRKGGGK